jgi:hypothetical protein
MRGRVRTLATRADGALTVRGGPVPLRRSGLDGPITTALDDEAVFVYPWEHYSYWMDEFGVTLGEAAFGENVTSIGLLETEVALGDTFRWGPAVVQVTHPGPGAAPAGVAAPREPWLHTGFFLRVLTPGTVRPEHELTLLDVDPLAVSVADAARIIALGPPSAGYTFDRVLIARHLFPAEVVAGLEASVERVGVSVEHGDERLTAAG